MLLEGLGAREGLPAASVLAYEVCVGAVAHLKGLIEGFYI